MSIRSDIQLLATTAVVELFELDLTNLGDIVYRFHAGVNGLGNDIVWQGNTYSRFPIEAEGFEKTSTGVLPRPKLKAANITGIISAMAFNFQDLVGGKIIRKRTFAKYLDSVNFPAPANLLLYSDQFNNASWTKQGTSVVPNSIINHTGSLSASKISETAVSSQHYVSRTRAIIPDKDYTLSVYFKAGTRIYGWLRGQRRDSSILHSATFNLSTGTVVHQVGCIPGIEPLGNGWYRAWITYNSHSGSLDYPEVHIGTSATASAPSTYLGDTSKYISCFGAQLEEGTKPTSYTSNNSSIINNIHADPNVYFPDDIWFIDRKSAENPIFVEFELAAAFDVLGVKLPRRQCIQNTCTWKYRGPECGYTGGAIATKNDLPTNVLADDVCGKRLSSCKIRFGNNSQLPYGGFPGVGLIK
jgi:phage-related protein